MPYVVLARRGRPQLFSSVVGQEHVTRTLQNAISSNRIAHAYLLTGPRGVGKTTIARLLAKAINCKNRDQSEPCNVCNSCVEISSGRSIDIIEIDAASNRGIDEIRELRENVKFAPVSVEYKVYIIDEVHMLTTEAFNALLKTLEEPPHHVVFILATTESHKIPMTILSRCQRFQNVDTESNSRTIEGTPEI
jgi:DNA polymerase-3 subunit gamma/tau